MSWAQPGAPRQRPEAAQQPESGAAQLPPGRRKKRAPCARSPHTARATARRAPACAARREAKDSARDGHLAENSRTRRLCSTRENSRQWVCTEARAEDRQSAQQGSCGGALAWRGQGRTFRRASSREAACKRASLSALRLPREHDQRRTTVREARGGGSGGQQVQPVDQRGVQSRL